MPEDYLTIDQVADRMSVPADMIRRRIESGDIPVHWVEVDGRLEMRVSADQVGVGGLAGLEAAPAPAAPAGTFQDWSAAQPTQDYSQALWSPTAEPQQGDWEGSSNGVGETGDQGEAVPLWRPDPSTWDDEPLQTADRAAQPSAGPEPVVASPQAAAEDDETASGDFPAYSNAGGFFDRPADELYSPPGASAFPGEDQFPEAAEPASAFATGLGEEGSQFSSAGTEESSFPSQLPGYATEADESAPSGYSAFGAEGEPVSEFAEDPLPAPDFDLDANPDSPTYGEQTPFSDLESPIEDAVRPSSLVASEADSGGFGVSNIDARELVAGLFERWERALEQRIQAEQRLRFEAELERRLRQVRDLRQELDTTRKAQAAQLAEHEREVMALRDQLREQDQSKIRRSLFKR